MARKTVITSVKYDEPQADIIEFPQNRTLYADQFTETGPLKDEDREGFQASNMAEVFDHFNPGKKIELKTEEGAPRDELFQFKSIKDFEDEQLIAKSELLRAEQGNIDAYNAIIQQLKNNKTLQKVIKDGASRDDLKNALKAILAEIENAEN